MHAVWRGVSPLIFLLLSAGEAGEILPKIVASESLKADDPFDIGVAGSLNSESATLLDSELTALFVSVSFDSDEKVVVLLLLLLILFDCAFFFTFFFEVWLSFSFDLLPAALGVLLVFILAFEWQDISGASWLLLLLKNLIVMKAILPSTI